MIRRPTVLVLGAGASAELRMPVGTDLLVDISQGVDPRGDGAFLRTEFPLPKLEAFHDAVTNAPIPHVDHLLAKRTVFRAVGRAAIAAALLIRERGAAMTVSPDRPRWCELLFDAMTRNREDFRENELSIVTFNYDRTIEHFFFESLKRVYPGGEAGARARVAAIPIVHLHGMLGGYPPLNRGKGVEFGAEVTASTVRSASRRIKIIDDVEDNDGLMEDDDDFQQAYELLHAAEQVLILGFGFDSKSLQRLALYEVLRPDTVVHATAHGVPEGIVRRVPETSGLGERLHLHTLTCTQLLRREGELFSFD